MKPSELRGKQPDELQKELEALLRAQFGLRMQLATQQLTNTSQLKKVRRDIARVRTIKIQKALVVRVERRVRDPLMGKTVTRSKKYHAHVDTGDYGEGDWVEIAECR